MLYMRHNAMDDTTDYYMQYDAQVLSEFYQVADDIAEFDLGNKEYYWGVERLPLRYQKLLGISNSNAAIKTNQTQLYQLDEKFVYILPYYSVDKEETFFVIHLFDVNNEAMFYQSWQNSFVLLLGLGLLLVVFYSIYTNRQITRQMDDFHQWIRALIHMDYAQLQQQTLPKDLSFEELVNSAQSLQLSLITQYELQQKEQSLVAREQHFLASLSHELRTPISIISAALSLLKISDNISVCDKEKLDKLSNANVKMKQLTETLLQLWRGQQRIEHEQVHDKEQSQLDHKVFLLDELVESTVSNCQQLFNNKNIRFSIHADDSADEHTAVFAHYELAEILINNLLSNACQYSADGEVRIDISNHQVVVENSTSNTNELSMNAGEKSPTSNINYGYGLGLFLANKICQQQAWQLNISETEQLFSVIVNFNKPNEKQVLG